MVRIEEVHRMLDALAAELPVEFYRELNGGIVLLPREKLSPHARRRDLFILGEYTHDRMGRAIRIYYGSLRRAYGQLDEETLFQKLRELLRHEFRHHMESLAGERGLEREDERRIAQYLAGLEYGVDEAPEDA